MAINFIHNLEAQVAPDGKENNMYLLTQHLPSPNFQRARKVKIKTK